MSSEFQNEDLSTQFQAWQPFKVIRNAIRTKKASVKIHTRKRFNSMSAAEIGVKSPLPLISSSSSTSAKRQAKKRKTTVPTTPSTDLSPSTPGVKSNFEYSSINLCTQQSQQADAAPVRPLLQHSYSSPPDCLASEESSTTNTYKNNNTNNSSNNNNLQNMELSKIFENNCFSMDNESYQYQPNEYNNVAGIYAPDNDGILDFRHIVEDEPLNRYNGLPSPTAKKLINYQDYEGDSLMPLHNANQEQESEESSEYVYKHNLFI